MRSCACKLDRQRSAEHGFTFARRSAEHGFTSLSRSAEHGFTPVRRSAEHGFTLVELLVALLIFSLLAAAGAAMLSFSVRAQAAASAKLDDIGALSRLSAALSADLAQADPRPTRDLDGHELPPFTGESGSASAPMIQLSRRGWTNLDGAGRSDLQKVDYMLANGRIERIAYPMLDGAQPLPASSLIERVADVRLRYRIDGGWSDRWQGTPQAPLPQAMEMTITRDDGRQYRQLFLVGTDYRPRLNPAGAARAG